MLNIFPIQFLAPLAYALLRVCVGFILLRLGRRHLHNRDALAPIFSFSLFPYGRFFVWYLGLIEIGLGILFFIGLFTQVAALLAAVLSLKFIVMHRRFAHPLIPSRMFYTLLLAASLSLFITGAGIFAFDLPI